MFNNENGYSLADIAAATGNGGYGNDGFFGGAGGWWIILLFLFAFGGWGNGGWGNNGVNAGGAMPYIYNMDSNSDKFYDLNTGILNGFATTTAAVTNGTSAIQSDISNLGLQACQNTNAITSAINGVTVGGLQNTFALTQQLSGMQAAQQLANCQTDQMISGALAQLNYNIATENCADRQAVMDGVRDIMENNNANTRSILDFLVQDRIAALQNENAALKTQASQAEQNAYLISQLRPVANPAYLTANPYTGQVFPISNGWPTYGYGCGCGCGGNNLVG